MEKGLPDVLLFSLFSPFPTSLSSSSFYLIFFLFLLQNLVDASWEQDESPLE